MNRLILISIFFLTGCVPVLTLNEMILQEKKTTQFKTNLSKDEFYECIMTNPVNVKAPIGIITATTSFVEQKYNNKSVFKNLDWINGGNFVFVYENDGYISYYSDIFATNSFYINQIVPHFQEQCGND